MAVEQDLMRDFRPIHQAVEGPQVGRAVELVGPCATWVPAQLIHQGHQPAGTPWIAHIRLAKIAEPERWYCAVHTLSPWEATAGAPRASHPRMKRQVKPTQEDRTNCNSCHQDRVPAWRNKFLENPSNPQTTNRTPRPSAILTAQMR